jgi:hypothetical protein
MGIGTARAPWKARLGHWLAHDGRHTAVSIMSSNGVPIQEISGPRLEERSLSGRASPRLPAPSPGLARLAFVACRGDRLHEKAEDLGALLGRQVFGVG